MAHHAAHFLTHLGAAFAAAELFDHLLHLLKLGQQPVHILHLHTAAGGDTPLSGRIDDLRLGALLHGHRVDNGAKAVKRALVNVLVLNLGADTGQHLNGVTQVLLIFFEGNEEKVIDSIISVLGVGREKFAFQQMYSNSEVNYKDIIFDFKRREVVKSNEEKKFTYTEFEILQLLAQNPGRVFSKEQIYDIVWNEPYSGDYNIVMSHISHIREKIEDDPSHPVYIQTVWGVGYKFNEKMCE